ncbi:2-oxoglutarate and iron-dependent oxygenase JMJD4 isoform X1 [Juglans microcarpa x Juglans regia]|uniref:2-oxoglutarate and iron-dependent oxygenase JMJD4 isoform X1 n=2 Tax=Juglans microcarpa x Juglans regia TaxID=2249226 RepID=UPI001B7E1AFF|nr:2-oxoglutarate and iron-dependent oxygenase JMJD4 isoform X1 [Juglans microcarpa x Juglans regia]
MGIRIGGNIEKVNAKELSYSEFVLKYMEKNQPVVMMGLMDDWKACKDWVFDNGKPNLQFFSTHFGNSRVQVADCGTKEFTDQKRVEMSVSEFVDRWLENSMEEQSSASTNLSYGDHVLYLKDWHFVKEYPEYLAYTTPLFFCDDWLNLYLDNYRMHKDPDTYQANNEIGCSDYRFVYMGAKGSWTPLHADVFRSYSWSANVCGRKQWLFLSPSQCNRVFDRNMKGSVYNIFDDVSEKEFPGFKEAIWLECTQEQNEIIFVPSGWYHQVHNLEDTISINHNWFNAYNLSWVWNLLLRDYDEAKEYIEDIRDICDDFEGLCQRNLAANTGMNFNDFYFVLAHFCLANVVELCCLRRNCENSIHSSSLVAQHLAMNLRSVRKTVLEIESVGGLDGNCGIFLDIRETLDDPSFLNLCTGLERVYGMIHKLKSGDIDTRKDLVDDLMDLDSIRTNGSQVFKAEELVIFIDKAIAKLGGTNGDEIDLLSERDGA